MSEALIKEELISEFKLLLKHNRDSNSHVLLRGNTADGTLAFSLLVRFHLREYFQGLVSHPLTLGRAGVARLAEMYFVEVDEHTFRV